MAARSIASLTLGFGLVSIPVKLFSATESSANVRFNLLTKDGSRVRQQYISEKDGKVVERAEMVKGYEFEKDKFVLFEPSELKALEEGSSHVVDIVAFVPEKSIDPIYYDKAYMLAPDKRGGKPYALLAEAMRKSGRCALARWSWKTKRYVVQVRPAEDGLMLQQLFFADEVRSLKDLNIEKVDVTQAELDLAMQLIDQIAEDGYDPSAYKDEEKVRVLEAIDRKIAGQQIVAHEEVESPASGQVIDLMEALRASLGKKGGAAASANGKAARAPEPETIPAGALKERKGVRRAPAAAPAPARARASKK
ncbi:MAG: Ku protein [Burkholderiaceae bacterium]|jgi:DNA end-binding protein Ku|nr:Ku protein [Burkholderiaceae bacterium]